MKAPPTDHERIRDYLLGQLPAEEEPEVESRLLTDREFYDELSIVEDELIDQYLGDALPVSDKESFESHFISSPERKQKLRFARALRKYISVTGDESEESADEPVSPEPFVPPPSNVSAFPIRRSAMSYAIAASILIVIGLGSLLFLWYLQGQNRRGSVLAVELIPAPATRGNSEVKQITIAPDVELIRLQLDLPSNDYPSYEAVLRDSSAREVLTTRNLKPQNVNSFNAVTMDVKADLAPGDYRLQLNGTTTDGRSESVATFPFTVRSQ